jgi:hypothetical protein
LDRSSHLIDWAPRECNRGKAITLTAASDATALDQHVTPRTRK